MQGPKARSSYYDVVVVCFITLPPRVSKTLENPSGNRWYVESSQGTRQRLSFEAAVDGWRRHRHWLRLRRAVQCRLWAKAVLAAWRWAVQSSELFGPAGGSCTCSCPVCQVRPRLPPPLPPLLPSATTLCITESLPRSSRRTPGPGPTSYTDTTGRLATTSTPPATTSTPRQVLVVLQYNT